METVTKTSTTQQFQSGVPQQKSDATKVVTQGAGLQKAMVNKETTFTVDASQAGKIFCSKLSIFTIFIRENDIYDVIYLFINRSKCSIIVYGLGMNMLMVGVMGPTYPCEEVHVRHQGRNKYTVSYRVKERGSYVLIVKWGDQHVPGSPFNVNVN